MKKLFACSNIFGYNYAKLMECIHIMSTKLKEKAYNNLKVAEYSETNLYFDSAVSRYYYYIYQQIIAYNEANIKDYSVNNAQNSHEITIKEFILHLINHNIINNGEEVVLLLLQDLRHKRNRSDYKNYKIVTNFVFEREFKYHFKLVTELLKSKTIIN